MPAPNHQQQQQQAFVQRIKQAHTTLEMSGLEPGDAAVPRLPTLSSAEPATVISSVISAMRSGLSVVRALLPRPLRKILDGTVSQRHEHRLYA